MGYETDPSNACAVSTVLLAEREMVALFYGGLRPLGAVGLHLLLRIESEENKHYEALHWDPEHRSDVLTSQRI